MAELFDFLKDIPNDFSVTPGASLSQSGLSSPPTIGVSPSPATSPTPDGGILSSIGNWFSNQRANSPLKDENIVSQIGDLLSATSAGMRGDPYYIQRKVQAAALLKQEQQKINVTQNDALIHTLTMANTLAKSGLSPESVDKLSPLIAQSLNGILGTDKAKPEDIKGLLTRPDDTEAMLAIFPEIARTGQLPQIKQ